MGSSTSSSRSPPPRRTPSLPWTVRMKLAALEVARSLHKDELLMMEAPATPSPPPPDASSSSSSEDGVRSADITIDASLGLWARVFCPSPAAAAAPPPLPVVVYFHGGGFVHFSPSSRPYDAFCRRLSAALAAVVVSVSYRMAPDHRFPAAYDDGVAALRFLDDNPDSLPLPATTAVEVDLSSCFLVGDSSGANIVHHVAQRWSAASSSSSATVTSPRPLRQRRLRVAGAVLIQPFFGGEERTAAELELDGKACRGILTVARADHFWSVFLPEGATRDHPAARVCGDDGGVELADAFPPAIMVVTGGLDLLRDWHARYVEALRGKGKVVTVVDYPDAFHGFYAFPELEDSGRLIQDMKLFVDDQRSKASQLDSGGLQD